MLALVSLASCRTPKLLCFAPTGLKEIGLRSDPGANGGRPVGVELVLVTQKKVLAEVGDLKARDYFARRALLTRKFPKGWLRRSWELQAGQYVPATAIKPPCNLQATMIFADYAGEVDATLRLEKAERGTLVLKDDGIAWIETED